ncbi:hypothetical protein EIP91_001216 [Steccherinum ochraceum]|uniref:Uncharacterized protein n=1 Tax=Steccherinum ochraceum TaxID=92696 RepID=A0A4V2MXP3_9APHY|nr:hypothetical protein EIP91_001216 [Steccherinum ochraceum]
MTGKRKNDESTPSQELSGREKKKQKTAAARTIAVQPSGPSTSATPQPQTANAVAGPSRVRFEEKQLPGSLDVERFAEARAFEINAMHTAMQTARVLHTELGKSFHGTCDEERPVMTSVACLYDYETKLERRYVMPRIGDPLSFMAPQMDPAKKKALGRSHPQRGKSKTIKRTKQLLHRQKDKVWLETHIWHAKRMKMENMWGYRLYNPQRSPSDRRIARPCMDLFFTMRLTLASSNYADLRRYYDLPSDAAAILKVQIRVPFMTGSRTCDTHIYKSGAYPFDLIAPVTVIWQSQDDTMWAKLGPSSLHRATKQNKHREDDLKVKATPTRRVWVRVHPSVYEHVYEALQTSASYALEAAKRANGPDAKVHLVVDITDLRERLNIFEIMGPKSSQVIKGALKPVFNPPREDFTKFWQALGNLQTTASVPRDMVIGFTVNDPRLTFPPKNAHIQSNGSHPASSPVANVFPKSILALSEIWDEDVREQLRKPKFKKKDLDQRRSENVVPGTPLQAKQTDDRIPVMLIQRSLETPPNSSESSTSSNDFASPSLHGWTLIVPSGWSMPFFSSLTYTGTRVGGQRERQTQSFEAGLAYFPRDFPCTKSYNTYAEQKAVEDRSRWDRKPPAKRPNYEVLGTRSPWQPDWSVVLGCQPVQGEDLVETQRAEQYVVVQPWLLRGRDIHKVLEGAATMFNNAAGLHDQINQLRKKRKLDPLDAVHRPQDLWKGALVRVKLRLVGRGSPDDLAVIYRVDDEEHDEWTAMFKEEAMQLDEEQNELATRKAPTADIIGYITTGNFSLALGEAYAIGAIPLSHFFALREQATRMGKYPHPLVKVRDRHGTVYRAAHLQVLE